MTPPDNGSSQWIRRFHVAQDHATRLVCFPHAGGSASYYFPASRALAPHIEVVALQYPGRQDRRREPLIDSIPELAELVTHELMPWVDRPFALFGHSMGAAVAFEVALRLRRAVGARPRHLFVSGRRAPSRPSPGRVHLQDDAGIIAELRRMGGTDRRLFDDDELLQSIVPVARNDYKASERYTAPPSAKVDCPITALLGTQDPQAAFDEVSDWRLHSTSGFNLRTFPGGHFYLELELDDVLGTISDQLQDEPCEEHVS